MTKKKSRRGFVQGAAGAALGVVGTALTSKAQSHELNPAAKAVMPGGNELNRAQILQKLGLNPSTPNDAWLAIVGCGSNAAALRATDKGRLQRKDVEE